MISGHKSLETEKHSSCSDSSYATAGVQFKFKEFGPQVCKMWGKKKQTTSSQLSVILKGCQKMCEDQVNFGAVSLYLKVSSVCVCVRERALTVFGYCENGSLSPLSVCCWFWAQHQNVQCLRQWLTASCGCYVWVSLLCVGVCQCFSCNVLCVCILANMKSSHIHAFVSMCLQQAQAMFMLVCMCVYIYVCVCVCVCVWQTALKCNDVKRECYLPGCLVLCNYKVL